mmetsp:Transcript_27581/g.55197  ORF Transcript_27581/g.55197 Transcript_27581/m.55197 type:complete len:127 (-) Transcript_27581:1214-1594(-)
MLSKALVVEIYRSPQDDRVRRMYVGVLDQERFVKRIKPLDLERAKEVKVTSVCVHRIITLGIKRLPCVCIATNDDDKRATQCGATRKVGVWNLYDGLSVVDLIRLCASACRARSYRLSCQISKLHR